MKYLITALSSALCVGFCSSRQFYGTFSGHPLSFYRATCGFLPAIALRASILQHPHVVNPSFYRCICCSLRAMASRAFGFLAPRRGQPQSFLGFSFQQVPRIQTEPWTCPWSKPPNLISLVFLVSTYIIIYLQHISTHIAEFLYISLHTSIPQSFIIVCPSSPPYNQKLCKNQQPSKFMVP